MKDNICFRFIQLNSFIFLNISERIEKKYLQTNSFASSTFEEKKNKKKTRKNFGGGGGGE